MESKFVNQFPLTFELYKEWMQHPVGRRAVKARRRRYILLAVGATLSLFLIILGIVNADSYSLYIGIVLLAFYLFLAVFNPTIAMKRQFRHSIRLLNGRPLIRTTTFGDKISIEVGNSKTEYEYREIIRVSEDTEYFYLFVNADTVIRVRRDSFILGESNAFRNFIDTAIANSAS